MATHGLSVVPDLKDVESALRQGHRYQVQFGSRVEGKVEVYKDHKFDSKMPADSDLYLKGLNDLCSEFGRRLNVRFYGHHSQVFDGEILRAIPAVASLVINCISDAENLECVETLKCLEDFSLGVFELKNKKILNHLPYAKLTELCVEECRTTALDLAPLENAVNLEVLKLYGHKKNIDVVGQLAGLSELVINPKKGLDLDFVNRLSKLKALKFVLGGLEEFDAISLPELDQLAVTRVHGLTSLGDLARFPNLRQLLVQDQKRLGSIQFSDKSKRLANVGIVNCKTLASLPGLNTLMALESLSVGETKLNVDDLKLPANLTHMTFYTGSTSGNLAAEETIRRAGLIPEEHPSMPFFYK